MEKKRYMAPAMEQIEIENTPLMAASPGKISDPEDNGDVDITTPGGTATVDQGSLMSLDDPHLWY